MATIISVVNEKGGVGKTTSILEIAYHLGDQGNKIVVIDLDSQENATKMLLGESLDNEILEQKKTIFDLLVDVKNKVKMSEVILPANDFWKNTLVIPSDCRLATIENHLQSRLNKEHILKSIIQKIESNFDYILIDLSPMMTILTVNALVASNYYLIPTDLSAYSQKGMRTIHEVANTLKETKNNPDLKFLGLFVTSYQKGGSIAVKALMDELQSEYKDKLLPIKIPDSVKVIESQRQFKPVSLLDSECSVAEAYRALTKIISTREICQ